MVLPLDSLSFVFPANNKKKWEDSVPVSLLKFIFAKWPDKYREGVGSDTLNTSRKHLCNYTVFVTMEIPGNGSVGVWLVSTRFCT